MTHAADWPPNSYQQIKLLAYLLQAIVVVATY